MRSFVIFALFALAVCQSPMDIITGFTNQLAFTDSQNQDVQNCLIGLAGQLQSLAPLYSDYVNHDLESLLTNAAVLFESFEPAVQAACEPVVEDLETYAVTFGNGQSTKINTEVNGAYVAQQVALLVQYGATHNFTAVGSTLGYIFQISIGSVDLPSVLPQQLTYDQAVLIQQNFQLLVTNENGSLDQFFTAYFAALGLSDSVNATALTQLVLEAPAFVQIIQAYQSAIRTGDFDGIITALETLITDLLEIVRGNQQGLQAIAAVDGPVLGALIRNPVKYVATIVYNVLLNAPQIFGMDGQFQQDILAGDFTAAGTTVGNVDATVYGPIF